MFCCYFQWKSNFQRPSARFNRTFYLIISIRLALAKRTQDEGDHRALLYNYFNQLNPQHYFIPKRNFDEIDRFSDFDKRNLNQNDRSSAFNGKRIILPASNFDEIDRNGFNDFKKRNFDEIDRHGFGNDF